MQWFYKNNKNNWYTMSCANWIHAKKWIITDNDMSFSFLLWQSKSIPPSATVKCPPFNHQILILDVDQVLNPWTRNPNCFIIKRQSSVLVHWWMNHAEFVNVLDALLDVRAIITMISWPCLLNFIKPNVEERCPLLIKLQLLCSWFFPHSCNHKQSLIPLS